jgi:signal transduction histidine kinase
MKPINNTKKGSLVKLKNNSMLGGSWLAPLSIEHENYATADDLGPRGADERVKEAADFFMTNVSHELRTPLSAILLWTKILSDKEGLTQEFKEGLQAIKECAEEQHALIESMVDISRLLAGKIQLEASEVDFISLVRSTVETLRWSKAGARLLIEEHFDPSIGLVRSDTNRLREIIWNLLSNAAKFSQPGGHILVRVERQRNDIEIQISDTGKGISADLLPYIFDRFRPAKNNMTGPKQGLGLSLYKTRLIVELFCGTISAQSAGPGKGATFIVRLPLPAVCVTRRGAKSDSATKYPYTAKISENLVPGMA